MTSWLPAVLMTLIAFALAWFACERLVDRSRRRRQAADAAAAVAAAGER